MQGENFPHVYGHGEEGDGEQDVPRSQAVLQAFGRGECPCCRIYVKKVVTGRANSGRSDPASTTDFLSTGNHQGATMALSLSH